MSEPQSSLTIGQCATLATLLEASMPKPGNVHRAADFDDLTYYDFVASAAAITPAMEAAPGRRLGETVLAAVQATRRLSSTNVNLGTVLLIAPLAMVRCGDPLRVGTAQVLRNLNADDAQLVYEAIRLANPGGIGRVDQADIQGKSPDDLLFAMELAAERDLVARQYTDDFAEVFDFVVPALREGLVLGWPLVDAVIRRTCRR